MTEFPNTQEEFKDISNKNWLNTDNTEVILWWDNPNLIPYLDKLLAPLLAILLGFVYLYLVLTNYPALQYVPSQFQLYPLLIIPLGTLLFGYEYLLIKKTFYVVTSKKIVFKKGILGEKDTNDLPFDKVQNTELKQRFHENLLNFGHIHIATAGTATVEQEFNNITYPELVKSVIQDTKQAYKEGLYD